MNVLSLFDGISCGMVALERAGIKVDKYYASEIDKYAIKISQKNYPNIIQLGDVTKWRNWDIDWANIDLLIGGSPCQGFSFAGKQLNFNDQRSKLFFVFVDILNHIKTLNPSVKYLLENVKMKKEYADKISELLEVEPNKINSDLFSAQHRNRLYWTNIVIEKVECSNKENILDILQPLNNVDVSFYHTRTAEQIRGYKFIQAKRAIQDINKKCECLLARDYKDPKSVIQENVLRRMTPIEYERLQTLTDNYTESVSNTQRYKAIGNGWTVDVIAHIFRGLK